MLSPQVRDSLTEAVRICRVLHASGHLAYFAGGCVRDALLGRPPKDFDVATDATPDRVREIFGRGNTLAFGASFGVIGVLPPKATRKKRGSLQPTEVATFRSDGEYSDGRRPDSVRFGDPENDALRRDFTVNGLFYDPDSERVIDFVNGQADLSIRRLRTIGAPQDRFEEDKLRMLRAVRFATTLEFDLEEATKDELIRRADEIEIVSGERIGAEMRRVVSCSTAADGLQMILGTGLSRKVFPELAAANTQQLRQRLDRRVSQDFVSSLALVLLSLGNDQPAPAKAVRNLADRWKLSGEEIRQVTAAMKHYRSIIDADSFAWSRLQPLLIDRDIEVTIRVAQAIAQADGDDGAGIERCKEALQWPQERLDPVPLVTGNQLIQLGMQPGPTFRSWLAQVRSMQLDGELADTDAAIEFVRELASRK
ncbi:hypothetical protein CGZ80_15120 [Rhodopirellula sp. MGV]|nr:hypothetical protein CGZ80_15120 [Rhodopirellula sp. MGV]PNY37503.1 CCA tRNA nucleotidyltransferase [Rhodopirellula baltica]